MRVKYKLSILKKICILLSLLSFSFQSVYLPSFASAKYETIQEFIDEYDPAVEYGNESQLLPKEGDDVERFLDLLFEDFPDLTEDQILRIVRECGRDISCWEAMASSYAFTNAEESGTEFKGGAFRRVWEGLKTVGRFVGSFVSDVWHTYREGGVRGLGERVGGYIGRVGGRVKGFVRRVWGGVKSRGRRIWNGTKRLFGGIKRGVERILRGVKGRLGKLFKREKKLSREDRIKEIEEKYTVDIADGTAKWSEEELDWLEDVLETLPSEFYDSDNLSKIERERDSDEGDSPCGNYNPGSHIIKIFDVSHYCVDDSYYLRLWQKRPLIIIRIPQLEKTRLVRRLRSGPRRLSFKIVLTHELTHAYMNDKDVLLNDFANISWEWKEFNVSYFDENGDLVKTESDHAWVRRSNAEGGASRYADELTYGNVGDTGIVVYSAGIGNPGEDLAEFIAYYVYAPRGLEKNSSQKYNLINNIIFDGKEFSK